MPLRSQERWAIPEGSGDPAGRSVNEVTALLKRVCRSMRVVLSVRTRCRAVDRRKRLLSHTLAHLGDGRRILSGSLSVPRHVFLVKTSCLAFSASVLRCSGRDSRQATVL
jgi:hypothetical protein